MFKSSYKSIFERAKQSFKGPITETDDKALKELLQASVKSAISAYEKGSISVNRQKDIQVIKLIFKNFDSVDECRKKLELYFSGRPAHDLFKEKQLSEKDNSELDKLSSHQFKTGLMDASKLEDFVTATVDAFYEHVIQPIIFAQKVSEDLTHVKSSLLNSLKNAHDEFTMGKGSILDIDFSYPSIEERIKQIGSERDLYSFLKEISSTNSNNKSLEYFFKKNIKPIMDKNIKFNENYSEKTIKYEFKDFLNVQLDKYRRERGNKQGSLYNYDDNIINSLAAHPSSNVKKLHISPLLKKHILKAQDEYNKHEAKYGEERQVKTKTWEKQEPTPQSQKPQKIIIALHGWRDSAECWNNLGQSAVEKGYKVIAYDHRGYGFDENRRDMGHNNDYLSIDFRKFVQSVIEENPGAEINLVGHSMGGAILLNNQNFIANLLQVKSVTCFSPAVTPSLGSYLSEFRNAILGREAHAEAIDRQQKNQPRFVQSSNLLKIMTTSVSLLSLMFQAHKALTSLITKQPDPNAANAAPWAIFYGKRDKAVPYSSFEAAQKNKTNDKVSFEEFSRGDHLLTQGRNASVPLDAFFKTIGPKPPVDNPENDRTLSL